jgi:hypothetical protein
VNAVVLVAIRYSMQRLPCDLPSQKFWAALWEFLEFCQHCMIAEFEHQVQLSFPPEHFQEIDQVRVF